MNATRTCSVDRCNGAHYARTFCRPHYRRFLKYGDPVGTPRPRKSQKPEERFWQKVTPTGFCWIWTGTKSGEGYGKFKPHSGRSSHWAHRYAYELLVGAIPEGMHLDHLCRNRACVNPDHIEPVSMAENIRRGFSPSARNGRKTHCKRGHEFTPENTWVVYRGSWEERRCRACQRLWLAKYRAKKNGDAKRHAELVEALGL